MRFQDSGTGWIPPSPFVQFKLYQGELLQYKPRASDPRSVLLRDSCRPGALGGAMSAPAGGAAAPAATGAVSSSAHAADGTIWSRQAQTCTRQARPRDGGENQGHTHRRTGCWPLHCSRSGRTDGAATRRDGGPPRARGCAHPSAHTRRTHRGLLHARPRRARHQATATDTGLRPPPANASTVCPSMRRPRLTCPAARLSPRPTSRPAVALLPARHWAPPGARDSLTKPR